MARYEVIESKAWKRDDGRTASLYGAVPWTSPSEEKRWKVVTRGYTVRDNVQGTVGIGRQPWATRAEAQEWVDKQTKRLAELAAAHGRGTKAAHATRKSPAQLQREIDEVLTKSSSREPKAGEYKKLATATSLPRIEKYINEFAYSTNYRVDPETLQITNPVKAPPEGWFVMRHRGGFLFGRKHGA